MEAIKINNRPVISEYKEIGEYVRDQISYLKKSDSSFSVLKACQKFRRLSPTLISLIVQNKRKVTLDRLDEISKLLQMTVAEKFFLRDWLERSEKNYQVDNIEVRQGSDSQRLKRKNVSLNILNDWLNVYVKDCFQIKALQNNPNLIYSHLAHIAEPKRIDKSIQFLLKEGYLRKTLDKKIVIETELAIAETPIPSIKVRQFHKAVLNIARNGIDTVAMNQRYINTLVLPLNEKKYADFIEIIQEFTDKLKQFSADLKSEDAEYLYQFNLNLVPTGRKEV